MASRYYKLDGGEVSRVPNDEILEVEKPCVQVTDEGQHTPTYNVGQKVVTLFDDNGARSRYLADSWDDAETVAEYVLHGMKEGVGEFAFGNNNHRGESCPAVTALGQFEEGDRTPGPTGRYDYLLRTITGEASGIVSEEEAKTAWIQGIWKKCYQGLKAGQVDSEKITGLRGTKAEEGVEIARELGWLPEPEGEDGE